MITVFATREGLIGHKTASGYIVDNFVPYVALPSTLALKKFVRVRNPLTHATVTAIVLDVGPWNEQDHSYVFQSCTLPPSMPEKVNGRRPLSESRVGSYSTPTNKAGIDLGELVWMTLGMEDNGMVEWEFI
jgi:hypothetical protein